MSDQALKSAAKLKFLKDLKSKMKSGMGAGGPQDENHPGEMSRVEVASPNPEGLKAGLSKAQEILAKRKELLGLAGHMKDEGKLPSSMGHKPQEPEAEMDEESPEHEASESPEEESSEHELPPALHGLSQHINNLPQEHLELLHAHISKKLKK